MTTSTSETRKSALRIIEIVIPIASLLFIGSSPSGCGGSGPQDTPSSGKANEIGITYDRINRSDGTTGDFWRIWRRLRPDIEADFDEVGISLAYDNRSTFSDAPLGWTGGGLQAYYNDHMPSASHPYLVVGVPDISQYTPGQAFDGLLGYSALFSGPPGSVNPEKYSFIGTQAIIRSYVWTHPDPNGVVVSDPVKSMFSYVLSHELGHVRAQLRHPSTSPFDHVNPTCIMTSLDDLDWSTGGAGADRLGVIAGHFCQASDPLQACCAKYLRATY